MKKWKNFGENTHNRDDLPQEDQTADTMIEPTQPLLEATSRDAEILSEETSSIQDEGIEKNEDSPNPNSDGQESSTEELSHTEAFETPNRLDQEADEERSTIAEDGQESDSDRSAEEEDTQAIEPHEAEPSQEGVVTIEPIEEAAEDRPSQDVVESTAQEELPVEETEKEGVFTERPIPDQPVAEKPKKEKKPLTKKQKRNLLIGVVSAILIVAIVLGIALPIYFTNRGKIFISTAEDFNDTDAKGDYYVLKKDVTVEGDLTLSKDVDLAGYTLTVEGTLTLNASAALNIGTKKGKEYAEEGALSVKNLVVNMPAGTLNFYANLQAQIVQITAQNAVMGGLAVSGTAQFNVGGELKLTREVQIKQPLTVSNCSNFYVLGNIACAEEGALVCKDTDLTVASGVTVDRLVLNKQVKEGDNLMQAGSSARIYGSVGSLSGGRKVAMLQGHSCPYYEDVELLAVARDNVGAFEARDCGTIVYIDVLSAPAMVKVQEESGRIVARTTEVTGAKQYVFNVDGKDQEPVDQPYLDISDILKGGAGKHTVTVYAKGDFDFDALETIAAQSGVTYMDGASIGTIYAYTITLAMPKISVSDHLLTIETVDFADYYSVYIGDLHLAGLEKIDLLTSAEGITVKDGMIVVDLSGYDIPVGSYGILVTAHSNVAEINSSKPALGSFVKKGQHAEAEITEASDMGEKGVTIRWNAVSTAKTYVVTVRYADGSYSHQIVTANTQIELQAIYNEHGEVIRADSVSVVAQGYGLYGDSTATGTVRRA